MQAPVLLALLLSLTAPGVRLGPEPPPMPRARVNTLWVVPELGVSWVEPLTVIRKPGGKLYTIEGNLTEYSIANSLRDAVDFLRTQPERCPGFAEAYRTHDLYFMWDDNDQPRGGPSAGLAFGVGAYAAMMDLPVLADVAFTGAVDASGQVKAVAGLALKVKACRQATMRTLCLPAADNVDYTTLDQGLAEELRLVAIERIDDAFFEAFGLAGPRKLDYDRLLNAWSDYKKAKAERRWTAARLALDDVIDLQPGDLSARRLAMGYARVDMREAALNLFADAAKYDRDGLPDEALRAVRRAWSYADAAQRGKHQALYDRLERAGLPPTDAAALARAETALADGDVVMAWRTIEDLCRRLPRNTYLAAYRQRWQGYGEVAAVAAAAGQHPDDVVLQSQLARAYLDKGLPTVAARVYNHLRQVEPDTPKWPLAEAYAWDRAKRPEKVAEVLRSMRPKFAVDAALAQTDYNVELRPPELQAPAWRTDGNLSWSLVRAADGSGTPRVTARLDDGQPLPAPGAGGRLEVDLGRLTAGQHVVHLSAVDRFGNEATAELPLEAPALDAASSLRILPPPAHLPPGRAMLDPRAAASQWLTTGMRLTVDGALAFAGEQALAKVTVGDQTATQPPFRLDLATAGKAEPFTLTSSATLADGSVVEGPKVDLHPSAQPPLWLVSPADGARLDGTVPVIVGTTGPTEGVDLTVWVDGQPLRRGPGMEALRLNTDTLASGAHTLLVTGDSAGRRLISPSIVVNTAPSTTLESLTPARPGEVWCLPISLAMLGARPANTDPAVSAAPAGGALRWAGATTNYTPARPPAATDTALRLETGFWPAKDRLSMALGDAVAFIGPADPAAIGAGVKLPAGPVGSYVWTPPRAGTWRLPLFGKALWLTVTDGPALTLGGVPNGALVKDRARLTVAAAEGIRQVTLLLGDRPLGTWPTPVPPLDLDVTKVRAGTYLLRAVGTDGDGLMSVSPPLAISF